MLRIVYGLIELGGVVDGKFHASVLNVYDPYLHNRSLGRNRRSCCSRNRLRILHSHNHHMGNLEYYQT